MKQFKFRSITSGLLGALLLLGTAAPLTFTSCENEHPEINITLTSDYSGIIDAINNVNKTLLEKLALIEQGIKDGNLQNQQALDLIQKAIGAVNGTLEQKLDAIKSVIESQTASLESKLALIEAAVKSGFADQKAAQELIKSAIESLTGSMEEKLEAIKTAIESQTTSLESKLALIETAVKEGFASQADAQELIKDAIESLEGTVEEKLEAIEEAIASQTTSLEGKLALIETALKEGFTDQKTALGEIKTALESIKGGVDGLDDTVSDIIDAIDGITDALADLNDTAGETNDALTGAIADALADIFDAIDGLSDYSEILAAIQTAIENIEITGGGSGDDPDPENTINGYEYVEMGDGLKWATMNVGATKPEEYGDYFAWGETAAKTDYSWSTYFDTSDGGSTFTKYATDKKTVLDLEDDAARQIWKGSWRIPTDAEWTALRDEANFKWDWTDDYEGTGIAGQVVISKVSGYEGNTIFLPAAGCRYGTSLDYAGSYGYYWSSSLYEYYSDRARGVYFYSEDVRRGYYYRYRGFSVRPVSE